jgi:membrane-associated phospholipid phosphatase
VSEALNSPGVVALDDLAHRAAVRLRGHAALDRTLYVLSEAANHSMLWHGINLADALLPGPDRARRALRRSLVIATEQALVNGPVKMVVKRKRPTALATHPYRLRSPRTSSFPSGHASAGACAATLLSEDLGLAPLWWSLAGMVAWSRVHVGVHHASDVLGGVAVGRSLAGVAGRLWPPPG